jgi:predicted nucleotidyltransferase
METNMREPEQRRQHMTDQLLDEVSQLLPALRETLRRHGVTRAGLFGSAARKEETALSDVDILVELMPGRSLLDQAALELELIALFRREVDVVTYQSLDPRIRPRVLQEEVDIL